MRRAHLRASALLIAVALAACGSEPQDLVDDLADPERREAARQELLLAKERAVEPLLAAVGDPRYEPSRQALVEILVSLMMRVEDERLPAALGDILRTDDDPAVRARVAHFAGMHRRIELADALLAALADEVGEVRHEALLAVNALEPRLSEAQQAQLDERRGAFLADPHSGVRLEALIRGERQVQELLQEAERAVLEARVAEAESLYTHTAAVHPYSQRARYREARYYYDNGQADRGLQLLREGGMLLDVPRLAQAPRIDGRLDEAAWQAAARADSFYQLSFRHSAAPPTENPATMWLGYDETSLYVGFRGVDAHPDSLVAVFTQEMAESADTYGGGPLQGTTIWKDDIIELFIDADFDHSDYAHMGINSHGVRVDEWIRRSQREMLEHVRPGEDWNDAAWRADDEVAAQVGDDHWSVEYRLAFDPERFPTPSPGAIWGFNLVRVYRGQEYSQWVRTYSGGHSPDDFGVLRFQ